MALETNGSQAQPPIEHWWAWDSAEKTFRHRLSGEELRYRGPVDVADSPADRTWHRFDYVYVPEQVRYPLLVYLKQQHFPPRVVYGDKPYFVDRPLTVWRLDHLKSAALWQSEANSPTPVPAYGLWRRADDAFWGALLQFRPIDIVGRPLDLIAINGGWWNGTWRPEFYRRYYSHKIAFPLIDHDSYDLRQDPVACLQRHPIEHYAMSRIDAPPNRWTQVETEACIFEKAWPPKRRVARTPCLMDQATGALLHNFDLGIDERAEEDRFGPSPIWRLQLPGCPINIHPPFNGRTERRDFRFLSHRVFRQDIGTTWWTHWFSTLDSSRLAGIIARRYKMPAAADIEGALAASWNIEVPDTPVFHPVYLLWRDVIADAVPIVTTESPGDTSESATRLWQAGTLLSFRLIAGGLAKFACQLRLALQLVDDPEGEDWVTLFA